MLKAYKNQIIWLLLSVIIVSNFAAYLISSEIKYIEIGIVNSIYTILMMLFLSYIWRYVVGKIISLVILLFFSVNFTISLISYFFYGNTFNHSYATSMLYTNTSEAASMLPQYVFYIILGIAFFTVCTLTVLMLRLVKFHKGIYWLSTLWILAPLAQTAYFVKNRINLTSNTSVFLKNTHFYHAFIFSESHEFNNALNKIKEVKTKYDFVATPTPIENIVVLIGESARKDNIALYGYDKNTSPQLLKEKANILFYSNALSMASNTILSLPMVLSALTPDTYIRNDEKTTARLADNIVKRANHANFETYWISTQGAGGQYVSTITNIATFAKNVIWVKGFDGKVIDEVKNVLMKNPAKKKIIFIHINGSHTDPCDKVPASFNKVQNENKFDCYDQSILYTDHIIGELFKTLSQSRSALLYFSDHGLKERNETYTHADSKEATKIPLLFWYSNQVPGAFKKTGVINSETTNKIATQEIERLTGIPPDHFNINYKECFKDGQLRFLKTNFQAINYKELAD